MPSSAPSLPQNHGKLLVVRLRNWVGDVILSVPALRLLQSCGYDLHLVGKPWAKDLLLGEGWTVDALAQGWFPRARQMRNLRTLGLSKDPGFSSRLNALCMPFSLSSALDMKLGGLRALGYSHEGRGIFLEETITRQDGLHELQAYWNLALPLASLSPSNEKPPEEIKLKVSKAHRDNAFQLKKSNGIHPGYLVICPFAGGTYEKQPKSWHHFPDAARRLIDMGLQVVLCPGPGEAAFAREQFPGCMVLEKVNLGVYAALLQTAALMISNDTGPGHLAAAVGTPTISVLGPTDPRQWGAWGPNVRIVQGDRNTWPSMQEVLDATRRMLDPIPASFDASKNERPN